MAMQSPVPAMPRQRCKVLKNGVKRMLKRRDIRSAVCRRGGMGRVDGVHTPGMYRAAHSAEELILADGARVVGEPRSEPAGADFLVNRVARMADEADGGLIRTDKGRGSD